MSSARGHLFLKADINILTGVKENDEPMYSTDDREWFWKEGDRKMPQTLTEASSTTDCDTRKHVLLFEMALNSHKKTEGD